MDRLRMDTWILIRFKTSRAFIVLSNHRKQNCATDRQTYYWNNLTGTVACNKKYARRFAPRKAQLNNYIYFMNSIDSFTLNTWSKSIGISRLKLLDWVKKRWFNVCQEKWLKFFFPMDLEDLRTYTYEWQ